MNTRSIQEQIHKNGSIPTDWDCTYYFTKEENAIGNNSGIKYYDKKNQKAKRKNDEQERQEQLTKFYNYEM